MARDKFYFDIFPGYPVISRTSGSFSGICGRRSHFGNIDIAAAVPMAPAPAPAPATVATFV